MKWEYKEVSFRLTDIGNHEEDFVLKLNSSEKFQGLENIFNYFGEQESTTVS